jgi:short-subunit dehydrogenase
MADREYALVTGASKGIGAELAEQLAADRWNVILVARGRAELETLATALATKHGVKALVLPADLSQPNAAADLWKRVSALAVKVDVLINNAGFGLLGPFRETPIQRELEMIQVNITALTELTKLALPPMLERRRGWILNVGSTAGFVPGPLMSVYYASKAYVLSFSEALVAELAGTGVSVTVLCPGPTRTQFSSTAHSSDSKLFEGGRVMDPGPVARAGLVGLFAGKAIVVPGFQNKLMIQALRIAPRWLVRKITRSLQLTAK